MRVADLKLVFYQEKGGYNNCQGEDQSNSDKRSRFSRDDTFLSVAEAPRCSFWNRCSKLLRLVHMFAFLSFQRKFDFLVNIISYRSYRHVR